MTRTPQAVWIVDTKKEHLAVDEALLRIPVIAILDTNCDPDESTSGPTTPYALFLAHSGARRRRRRWPNGRSGAQTGTEGGAGANAGLGGSGLLGASQEPAQAHRTTGGA